MPVRYKLETKGFSEYFERLHEAGEDIDRIADQSLEAGGDILLEGMDQRVPKDTGNLQAHLVRSESVQDGNFHTVTVGLGADTPGETLRYGGAQEYGWGPDHPARSYIRATIDEDMKSVRAAMKAIYDFFLKTGRPK